MTMRSKQWYTKTSRLEYSFAKSSIGRRSSNRFLTTRSSDRRPVESKFQISLARPYAGVSTAILVFTKTNSGGTGHVWFYDMEADGWSLDDKRQPLLPEEKLGPIPSATLSSGDHTKNNPPD